MAWWLYLPENLAVDPRRRVQAGEPEELRFATKTQIALAQLRALLAEGAPRHWVLADAGCDVDTALRQALSDMGLEWARTRRSWCVHPGSSRCHPSSTAAQAGGR